VSGRLFTISLVAAIPALSGGAAGSAPAVGPAAVDTILRSDLDRPPRAVRLGLTAAEDEPHVTLGLRRIRLVPGRGLGAVRTPVRLVASPPGVADSLAVEPLADAALRWRVGRLSGPPRAGPSFLSEPTDARLVRLPEDEAGRFVTTTRISP
jgi:hypothetical protein